MRHAIRSRTAVHPHTRGDSASSPTIGTVHLRFTPTRVGTAPVDSSSGTLSCGSPPHAWGQRSRSPTMRTASPVHPHTRGDSDRSRVRRGTLPSGSPPHAWGQRTRHSHGQLGVRFTPTRVGTASFPPIDAAAASVHPHTRGDSERCDRQRQRTYSVHPHTRGDSASRLAMQPVPLAVHPHTRGDSSTLLRRIPVGPVHPHTRGDSALP